MWLSKWLPFGEVPEVSAQQLHEMICASEVQLVDVRTGAEFRHSRIPGARHLPISRFNKASIREFSLDPERPVVAICLSAHRSIPAVRELRELGYSASQLKSGMRAWWQASLPCDKG